MFAESGALGGLLSISARTISRYVVLLKLVNGETVFPGKNLVYAYPDCSSSIPIVPHGVGIPAVIVRVYGVRYSIPRETLAFLVSPISKRI